MSHDNDKPLADAIKELEGPADALDALRAALVADAMEDANAMKERLADEFARGDRHGWLSQTQRVVGEAQRQETSLHEAPKPKRTRKRKPTLAGVARQAARAGIEVAGYEVQDGSDRGHHRQACRCERDRQGQITRRPERVEVRWPRSDWTTSAPSSTVAASRATRSVAGGTSGSRSRAVPAAPSSWTATTRCSTRPAGR